MIGMKYRHKNQSPHLLYELLLEETDKKGLAVYSQRLSGGKFNYLLFRPVDMLEVKDSQTKQGV